MNRKTLDFPHPSSCSNFPNSNVIVDTMTPPNVGLKRASYQIFRRSGFREICVGVRLVKLSRYLETIKEIANVSFDREKSRSPGQ